MLMGDNKEIVVVVVKKVVISEFFVEVLFEDKVNKVYEL